MRDQRIEARPALDLVDAGDRRGIGGVGGKPVDRLGRDGDGCACAAQDATRQRQAHAAVYADVDQFGHVRASDGDMQTGL